MALTVIPFVFPGIRGVRCAFQTRLGGAWPSSAGQEYDGANISYGVGDDTARVRENRRLLYQTLGVVHWIELVQVHGNRLLCDSEPLSNIDQPPVAEADGHATDRPGYGLVIKTADCQPVLLAHTSGRYVAALHVGWRGNRMEFIQSAVAEFCGYYSVLSKDLMAVRGPSLGPGAAQFTGFDTEWGATWREWFDPVAMAMDLWSLTRCQLQQAGLPRQNIFGIDLCTWTLHETFFSYRRAKNSGRQAACIWIVP